MAPLAARPAQIGAGPRPEGAIDRPPVTAIGRDGSLRAIVSLDGHRGDRRFPHSARGAQHTRVVASGPTPPRPKRTGCGTVACYGHFVGMADRGPNFGFGNGCHAPFRFGRGSRQEGTGMPRFRFSSRSGAHFGWWPARLWPPKESASRKALGRPISHAGRQDDPGFAQSGEGRAPSRFATRKRIRQADRALDAESGAGDPLPVSACPFEVQGPVAGRGFPALGLFAGPVRSDVEAISTTTPARSGKQVDFRDLSAGGDRGHGM